MAHKLWFDGVCSADYGIYISGENSFSAPERDTATVEVPGRNGALVFDNGRYKNVTITYPAIIYRNFAQNVEAAKCWLLGNHGYCILESDYDPLHYRMARYSGPIDFNTWFLNRAATVELTFDCKPQRFLKAGEMPLTMSRAGKVFNPAPFQALPLVTVRGNGAGELHINGVTIQIFALSDYLVVDCDTQNAYKGTENKNGSIYAPAFPVLTPGENAVAWSGGVTSVELTPRWWTL